MTDIMISKNTIDYISESLAEKVYEKTNIYRWHDLRKNPEDLPEENQNVLAYMCYSKKEYVYVVTNAKDCQRISESVWEVLGWKYIEPFNI